MMFINRRRLGLARWHFLVVASAVLLVHPKGASAQSIVMDVPQSEASLLVEAHSFSCLEVVKGSIFGVPGDQRTWRPLTASTLFTEGWDEPWIGPPSGSGGAPRQGWINAADGHFNRNVFGVYSFTNGQTGGGDQHQASLVFQSPLSRRLYLSVEAPFLSAVEGRSDHKDDVALGDARVGLGVMVHETEDLSISAHLSLRMPTGDTVTGGGQTSLLPNVQFWCNVADGWVVRGGTGIEVPLNQVTGPDGIVTSSLAIGRVLTPHDAAPFGDLALYVAAVMQNELSGSGNTFFSFTPGFRTHLGNNFFLLGGLEIPVTGPKTFEERLVFVLVKGF